MKKFLLLYILLTVLGNAWSQSSDVRVLADSGESFDGRKDAITRRWNELRPAFIGNNYFDSVPSATAPYSAGKLKRNYLQDAVNMVNFFRFLTGLPDDVELKDDYTDLAQHGNVLNAAHKQMAHQLPRPSNMPNDFYQRASTGIGSSNLGWGYTNLNSAVSGWIDDSDDGNKDRLGHRRWVLNPSMRYTGFGQADVFTAMYSSDTARKERVDYQAICYPGGSAFPNDFFQGHYAWNISLNPALYQTPDRSSVSVTLTDKKSGKVWQFSRNSREYFNIDTVNYGVPICIIFQPSNISEYSGTYSVEVAGLKDKQGNPRKLYYEVSFFALEVTAGASDFKTTVNGSGASRTMTITGYTGSIKNLIIPEEINGIPVTTIGKGAFTYADVNTITLPSTITTIEAQSLWYSKITNINIPSGVESIGDQAFSGCSELTAITIPSTVTVIGNFAFMDCSKLTTVDIPSGANIGYGAFRGCSKLTPSVRSNIMKQFGNKAFQ
jgi:hypothetical protein